MGRHGRSLLGSGCTDTASVDGHALSSASRMCIGPNQESRFDEIAAVNGHFNAKPQNGSGRNAYTGRTVARYAEGNEGAARIRCGKIANNPRGGP